MQVGVGVPAEPRHLNRVTAFVIHVRKVHRAVFVARYMHHKTQGVHIAFFVLHDGYKAVQSAEQVSSFFRIVSQRSYYSAVTHSSVQILIVPTVLYALRIDGIALDFVRPVCPINHPVVAQSLVHCLARAFIKVIVRDLGYDAVTFLSPTECRQTVHARQSKDKKKRNDAFHRIYLISLQRYNKKMEYANFLNKKFSLSYLTAVGAQRAAL